MKRVKFIMGIIFMFMAMGELATGFWAFPAIINWCDTRIEWWAEHLPMLMLLNSVIACVLLMFYGVKMMKDSSLFTDKQAQWLDRKVNRWLEKRKYGYCKSDYIQSKEVKVDE